MPNSVVTLASFQSPRELHRSRLYMEVRTLNYKPNEKYVSCSNLRFQIISWIEVGIILSNNSLNRIFLIIVLWHMSTADINTSK